MTSWVSTEILSRETPSQRAAVIENFIKIATYCYKHNDMHCALNITIALGSACIKCLRHTWEEVDKRYRIKFEKLKDWTDYHGRCKKMREKLERWNEHMTYKYLLSCDEHVTYKYLLSCDVLYCSLALPVLYIDVSSFLFSFLLHPPHSQNHCRIPPKEWVSPCNQVVYFDQ